MIGGGRFALDVNRLKLEAENFAPNQCRALKYIKINVHTGKHFHGKNIGL
jgi:hypothetical protein